MALHAHSHDMPEPPEALIGQDETTHQQRPRSPNQMAMQAIEDTHLASQAMLQAVRELVALERARQVPPDVETIVIDAAHNPRVSTAYEVAASVGVYNPSSITVFLGLAGQSATANNRQPSVSPNSLLVLPMQAAEIELGVDPIALGGNTAVVWLMRFKTLQPAFLHAIA